MRESKRDTGVKNRLLDSVEEDEGGMIWENSIENMYTIISEIDRQSRFHAWGRVLRAGAWDDPERWDGEGGGREGLDGEHIYARGWFMSVYGKNHHNIVK